MDPENPPRRTKPDQEPLTIDLHATPETSDAARPEERGVRPDAVERDMTERDPMTQGASDETVVPDAATVDSERDADGGTPSHGHTPADTLSQTEAEAAEEARAEAAAAAFAEEPASSTRSETFSEAGSSSRPKNASRPSSPSRSGALAAGILGGLIALAGAGVLQYAGVVPSIGPSSSGNADPGRDLGAEIDALKAQISSTGASGGEGVEQRLSALEQSVGATGDASGTDNLKAQVESLTQDLATVKSGLADQSRAAETAASQLSTRIEEAERKLEEPASDVQLARAIAVTALKTSIDRGGPFLAELDALKSISPDDPAVAGLAGVAQRGVPSRSDLTRTFPDTADAMLSAIRGADPNQGIFSRLIGSAASAVRVRPVGSVEGTGPEAVVARIEDRLTNGDLKGASLEWDGLPQPAKDAGADFRAKLDERIEVEGLIDAAVAGAATGSTPAKQG
ncbi:COG4223 family protein [Rhizobium sp. 9140]|uniref:COG4223 family protein n=1 Tax=Rhizobium sp. 9140 TaxID=1761900 RepID=UPI000796F715|nr:mitofilin family membrane protein [Rhizobium sp. 9140]CZT33340.1 Uncharacterized conserved protein [Rhizobium sp. 9140]